MRSTRSEARWRSSAGTRSRDGRDSLRRCVLAIRLRSHGAQGERPPLHPQPPREPQQHQEHAGVPRRPGLRDRRRRHLVGQAPGVAASASTPPRPATSRTAACCGPIRSSATAARRPRSTTGWSTWPIAAARCIASTPRPAAPTGSTTPAAKSGPRPWWPTARSTSARARAISGSWPPARRSGSSARSAWTTRSISTAVAANGTLYVGTMTRLYALPARGTQYAAPLRA